jgi:hypothetical protein
MKQRLLGVVGASVLALTAFGVPAVTAKQPKVEICHFPGHWHSVTVLGFTLPDYYIDGQLSEYIAGQCPLLGGKVLSVKANAATHGHGAVSYYDLIPV